MPVAVVGFETLGNPTNKPVHYVAMFGRDPSDDFFSRFRFGVSTQQYLVAVLQAVGLHRIALDAEREVEVHSIR